MKKKYIFTILIVLILAVGVFVSLSLKPLNKSGKNNTIDDDIILSGDLKLGIANPPKPQGEIIDVLNDLNVYGIRMNSPKWADSEKERGEYNFIWLEQRIDELNENNIKFVSSVGHNVPRWACEEGTIEVGVSIEEHLVNCKVKNTDDFRNFAKAYFSKLGKKIHIVQFTNEWTWTWTRPVDELIELNNILYDEAKKSNPDLPVSLGSVPIGVVRLMYIYEEGLDRDFDYIDGYIENGKMYNCDGTGVKTTEEKLRKYVEEKIDPVLKNAKYDMLDLHFYDDSDNWDEYESAWRKHLKKLGKDENIPIIVTEFGGPHYECEDAKDEELQVKRLGEYIEALEKMNVEEAYFFKLAEGSKIHFESGLYKKKQGTSGQDIYDYVKKPNYDVFKEYANQINL